jgi:hypothetical protein
VITWRDRPASSDQTNAPHLSLDLGEDAADRVSHRQERLQDRRSFHGLDFPKSYAQGDVEIVVHLRVGANDRVHELVFFAVPTGLLPAQLKMAGLAAGAGRGAENPTVSAANNADGNDKTMRTLSANPVECPDRIVPAFVRLEPLKKRQDVRWEVFQVAPQDVLNICGIVRDGKVKEVWSFDSAGNSDRVNSLIEAGPERLEGFIGEVSNDTGDISDELYLVLVQSIRITLNNSTVWARLLMHESAPAGFDIVDVLLCARESALGTGEVVGSC